MKELSIEEKAKAYDEAIERAKKVLLDCTSEEQKVVEYITPELKESEDERIWKLIKKYAHSNISDMALNADYITREQLESWLEKQGEHANFLNKIQVGDKVTRNQDGVLVNLSQLNRVAKKQGEQKSTEWSEEDIETFERIISNYEYFCNTLTLEENWSETEKEACKKVDYEDIKWLKSLKDRCLPQSQWKPSEEQLTSLAWVIEYGNTSQTETLKMLLEQLKTLKL